MNYAIRGAFMAALLCLSLTAAEKRTITPADLWAMKRVGNPAISPDGKWVAFTVTTYDMKTNDSDGNLWLVPSDGATPARQITWHKGSDSSPFWSPDGSQLGFLSRRDGDDATQIYLLPMAGGEARPVTSLPIGPSSPRFFPDGKRILFTASTWDDLDDDFKAVKERLEEGRKDKTKAKTSDTRIVRYWDQYRTDGRNAHLFVLDLETEKVTDITRDFPDLLIGFPRAGGGFDLSPDGTQVALVANSTKPPFKALNMDVYLLPVAGGEPVNITADNPATDSSPRFSPDGNYLVYGYDERPEVSPDFNHLMRYDLRDGSKLGLTERWDNQPDSWFFSDDGKQVLFLAPEQGSTHLFSAPLAGGEVTRLIDEGTLGDPSGGPGGLIAYTSETTLKPAELMIRNGNGEMKALTNLNKELIAELDLGRLESVTFEGADKDEVQMFVFYPPGFDPGKKWPLVQVIHGGPHGASRDSFHYRWNMAMFAAKGHVVAAVNFHGSTGFGQKFAESILGNHADKPFTDIMKATDFLLAKGFIDETRMAAAGGSYGGYMVAWIQGRTDRFACLINHAGVYDLMAQFASDWTWGRPNNYGAPPWGDPERIDRYSPSRYAKNFKTPTLILHGEKDYRVPYTQGLNMHGVLTGMGVPSRLVIFPDENHWILHPQSSQLWWDEVYAWLAKYTGGS